MYTHREAVLAIDQKHVVLSTDGGPTVVTVTPQGTTAATATRRVLPLNMLNVYGARGIQVGDRVLVRESSDGFHFPDLVL